MKGRVQFTKLRKKDQEIPRESTFRPNKILVIALIAADLLDKRDTLIDEWEINHAQVAVLKRTFIVRPDSENLNIR